LKDSPKFPMLTPSMAPRPCAPGGRRGIRQPSRHGSKHSSHSTLLFDGRQPAALSANENPYIACHEGQQAMTSLCSSTGSRYGQLPEPSKAKPQPASTGPHGPPPCARRSPVPGLSELERPVVSCPSPGGGHLDRVRPWRVPPEPTSPPLHRAPAIIHETTSHAQSGFQRSTCLLHLRPTTARSSLRCTHLLKGIFAPWRDLAPDTLPLPLHKATLEPDDLFTSQPKPARISGKPPPEFSEPTGEGCPRPRQAAGGLTVRAEGPARLEGRQVW
jgi:hypothetical protein